MKPEFEHITTWLFDLDDTLYHPDTGFFVQLMNQMRSTAAHMLELEMAELKKLSLEYRDKYGMSFTGFHLHHPEMDMDEFIERGFDIDLSPLRPCEKLEKMLQSLPGQKVVFTNSPDVHASRVLRKLELDHVFDDIFDTTQFDFYGKPHRHVYDQVMDMLGVDPKNCAMFEDSHVNLKTAHEMGMKAILVNQKEKPDVPYISHHAARLHDFLEWLHSTEVSDN